MRDNVRAFVEIAAQVLRLRGPVFEFGAYQVEGQDGFSDLRGAFVGHSYTGCDMREGPGVDRIEDLSSLSLPDGSAQTIICVDTLEHVFEVRRAVDEMLRVLAPGGTMLLAAPMDFRIHEYPDDYWRLTPACMTRLLLPLDATLVGSQGTECHPHTVFAIGCRAPLSPSLVPNLQRFIHDFEKWLSAARRGQPLSRRMKQAAIGWLRSRGERRRAREYYTARFAMHVAAPAAHFGKKASAKSSSTGGRIDLLS